MHDFEALNRQFATESDVHFSALAAGFTMVDIRNVWGTARISLYGGQLLGWQPVHQATPVLWLSKRFQYQQGKAIRGGVPICWPWFGAHRANALAPAHGYARISQWSVVSVRTMIQGETEITLELEASQLSQQFGSSGVGLSLRIRVGAALEFALTTTNMGSEEAVLSEGLHTYFQVAEVGNTRVHGLDSCEYADLLRGNLRCQQSGAIGFDGELGRIFVNSAATCVIEDPGLRRRIRIEKTGSLSTAVWNPWIATASKMDDLGPEGWRNMVCVESANALENLVTLPAGKTHTLTAKYVVEEMP